MDANDEATTLKGGFTSYSEAYNYSALSKEGIYATAFGYKTKAIGDYSTAFGADATASGDYSTAFGEGTKASRVASTAFGSRTTASGDYSTAFGGDTKAMGMFSTAFGIGTEARGWGATAFGEGTITNGYRATAFGYYTIAGGRHSTAFGEQSKVNTEASTAWGSNTTAGGLFYGPDKTEVFIERYYDIEDDTYKFRIMNATDSSQIQDSFLSYYDALNDSQMTTTGSYATAFGKETKAYGEASTAFGIASSAAAENSLAALGGITDTAATNSAAIGKGATVSAADSFAFGNGASATVEGSVALGSGSEATVAGEVAGYDPTTGTASTNTSGAWKSTNAAIAVGKADGSVTRQIIGVAAGTEDTDAVNVAQLKAVAAGAVYTAVDGIDITTDNKVSVKADTNDFVFDSGTLTLKKDGVVASGNNGVVTGGTVFTETRVAADGNHIKVANSAADNLTALDNAIGTTADGNYVKESNTVGENINALDTQLASVAGGSAADIAAANARISSLDGKVEKVGAGAAALAALHPLDTDSKFGIAAGFGNYRGANAMALGLFYRPTDKVMLSLGGSMGNGENLMNVGVTFALDKGVTTSKAAMARTIKALEEKNANQAAKIESLEARLAALEAKMGK